MADANRALELNPNLAETYAHRAAAQSSKGEREQALADYNRSLELNPHSARTYSSRGIVYGDKGEWDRAIADLTRALEFSPAAAQVYRQRGVYYGRKGEVDRGLADLNRALELDHGDALAYYDMAELRKGPAAKKTPCTPINISSESAVYRPRTQSKENISGRPGKRSRSWRNWWGNEWEILTG